MKHQVTRVCVLTHFQPVKQQLLTICLMVASSSNTVCVRPLMVFINSATAFSSLSRLAALPGGCVLSAVEVDLTVSGRTPAVGSALLVSRPGWRHLAELSSKLAGNRSSEVFSWRNNHSSYTSTHKKAQLMLAYPRDAKTMKKNPPFRSYNKFQSSRKSGVYSN